MSKKSPAVISVLLTVLLLFVIAILFVFFQLIALNGVMDSRATVAIGILITLQLVILLLAGIFVRWFSNFLLAKLNGNKTLALVLTVLVGTFLGTVLFFFSIIISILSAGIK